MRHPLALLALLAMIAALGGCATGPVVSFERPAPAYALPAAADGALARLESRIRAAHGPDASGFELLDRNEDALRWRLALIDSARQSIDVQYYLWFGDAAGRLLVSRLLDAADRGVKVRMLIDDLNTLISDATTVALRDEVAAWIDAHPNVEVRLFNPWSRRTLMGRLGESANEFERVNQRMHNKALVADNRAAILGGRNIGDEYMGLNTAFNFHDLDVLGIGPVARQTSDVFDAYWNSAWVMPTAALGLPISLETRTAGREELRRRLEAADALARISIAPRSWATEFAGLDQRLHIGTSRVESDLPAGDLIDQLMWYRIRELLATTTRELLILNAYIIPGDPGIDALKRVKDLGGDVRILTNSLASHDVPAVNSHYKGWRRPILETGAELYEMRHDAAIQPLVSDTAPTRAAFMGLHSKAMVVDRERVYIGSMNFDPRSAQLNTEMGVFVDSPSLADALARLIERDIAPENSWRVELDGRGGLRWVNDQTTVARQPARNWWQRVEDVFFMALPKDLY